MKISVMDWGLMAIFGVLAMGCFPPQHLPAHDLQVEGLDRRYHVFIPEAAPAQPMPLVVFFHGGGGAGQVFPSQQAFEDLAQTENVILAFPQGLRVGDNEGEWQLNTRPSSRHDIDFVVAMINDISSRHPVNPTRIYGVGYSLGSMFAYEVACQLADRFAAIASFAGTMPLSPANCAPARFVPILHVHGDADGIIAYNNTWQWKSWDEVGTMMDIRSLLHFWKTKYACQGNRESSSPTTEYTVHDACKQNATVEHYRLKNGDHGWPDSINGRPTSEVMWSFLKRFAL